MNGRNLSWRLDSTPVELHSMLEALAEEYPIKKDVDDGIFVKFQKSEDSCLTVSLNGNEALVKYDKTSGAARAAGALLAGLPENGGELKEKIPFSTFGIMLDCSRNAVMTVEHLRKWLRRLALMGYNMAMLYTEDTYELPGEDYFGYMRGRYTADELKEIDDYASKLGIEMIGCIQTLGHLAQMLKWPVYSDIFDTREVMLTSEEKTYTLIDKMLDLFGSVFKSRRIHVGMDETHDLGRGRFMDLNGYKRGFDIFNEHLAKVVDKCKARGLQPMIWSDMYFRMGSKTQGYYDKECVIPDDVKEMIPKEAQLVYWDYYHEDEEFYRDWIKRHRDLGFNPLMGSGVWTWKKFWHHHEQTKKTIDPCIDACLKENLDEFFFTMWGDDGAYCDFDSALAGLCYAAERCYNNSEPDEDMLEKRFSAVCDGSYKAHLIASEIHDKLLPVSLLWDDPIIGIHWNNEKSKSEKLWSDASKSLSEIEGKLAECEKGSAGDIDHVMTLIKVLKSKIDLRLTLDSAYSARDNDALNSVQKMISSHIEAVKKLSVTFRRQWMSKNKPFGFEVIQIRLAGQIARYEELSERIEELVCGETECIPEFEEKASGVEALNNSYSRLATGSSIL